jgi:hypothetical protein
VLQLNFDGVNAESLAKEIQEKMAPGVVVAVRADGFADLVAIAIEEVWEKGRVGQDEARAVFGSGLRRRFVGHGERLEKERPGVKTVRGSVKSCRLFA